MKLSSHIDPRLVESIRKAQKNLVNFRHIVLTTGKDEVPPADFHYKWSENLLHGTTHTAIEGFRQSAKTQYVIRTFILYSLMFPSKDRDYIVLIKNNATMARAKLKEIEQEYKSNPLLSANVKEERECSSDVFSIDVYDQKGDVINVRIEAYGKGASIRGLANIDRRPKITIIDDPQDIEDAKSETVTESDWGWFLSDVMFLGKDTRIFLIGNNLGERCIIERVFANAENLNFQTQKLPCMINEQSTWEAMFSFEDIQKQKEAYNKMGEIEIWYREKMCEAIAPERQTFKREDFRYYTPDMRMRIASECNIYIRTDLAISQKQDADFSVILVCGIDDRNNWFVLDTAYGRYDPTQFINTLFTMVVRWRPLNVGLEKVQYQAAMEHLVTQEMSKRNAFFNIIEQKADKQKELRIKSIQPRFKAHTIWFPDSADWITELESELLLFPKGLHDDLVDTLAYMTQETQAPYKRTEIRTLQDTAISDCVLIGR